MKPKGRNQNETQRSCLHLDNCTENDSKKGQLQTAKKRVERRAEDAVGKKKTIGLRIESDEKIKLIRAQGGCPGTIRRRRTWQAAKSYGEPQAGADP